MLFGSAVDDASSGPQSCKRPDDVACGQVTLEVTIRRGQQVVHFGWVDGRRGRVAVELALRRADQCVVMLVRDGEDDATIGRLEKVGEAVIEQLRHDDMTALDQPWVTPGRHRRGLVQKIGNPRTGRVHDAACPDCYDGAVCMLERCDPLVVLGAQTHAAGSRLHDCAVLRGIDRVGDDESRVVDPAVGEQEAGSITTLERCAGRMLPQVDRRGAGQVASLRQVIVEEQGGTDHPGRSQVRIVRQHETQRPCQVRCGGENDLALAQGFAHESEVVMLEVAQAAMHELGARRRRVGGQVVLFAEHDLQAATRGIARDARTIDAAADDQHVAARCTRVQR
jgi:hypothetical protein